MPGQRAKAARSASWTAAGYRQAGCPSDCRERRFAGECGRPADGSQIVVLIEPWGGAGLFVRLELEHDQFGERAGGGDGRGRRVSSRPIPSEGPDCASPKVATPYSRLLRVVHEKAAPARCRCISVSCPRLGVGASRVGQASLPASWRGIPAPSSQFHRGARPWKRAAGMPPELAGKDACPTPPVRVPPLVSSSTAPVPAEGCRKLRCAGASPRPQVALVRSPRPL